MELAHIRYFVMLCNERNFTRAARRCGVSQPSLSNGIKTLESELGGKLFDRSGKVLTALGKTLRPQFESAIASVGQIEKRAAAFHRRQGARRRAAAAQSLRLDAAVPLNGTQSFENAPQSSAAHKPNGCESRADQQISPAATASPSKQEIANCDSSASTSRLTSSQTPLAHHQAT